jgi:hypothetical protein
MPKFHSQFYNYYRQYDSRTGRYTQPDPIGLDGGWNRFGYVGGNPTGVVDPYGLWEFVFNAGFHVPAFPLFGVSGGPSAGSSWKPGEGLSGASFNGVAGEAELLQGWQASFSEFGLGPIRRSSAEL